MSHVLLTFLRLFLLSTPLSFLVNFNLLPPVTGQLHNLQPNTRALGLFHQILDDKRVRLSPEKGGLGIILLGIQYMGCIRLLGSITMKALSPRKGSEFGLVK
jgi:hypothetical protein